MIRTKANESHLLELASKIIALVQEQALDEMEAVAALNIAQVILAARPADSRFSELAGGE